MSSQTKITFVGETSQIPQILHKRLKQYSIINSNNNKQLLSSYYDIIAYSFPKVIILSALSLIILKVVSSSFSTFIVITGILRLESKYTVFWEIVPTANVPPSMGKGREGVIGRRGWIWSVLKEKGLSTGRRFWVFMNSWRHIFLSFIITNFLLKKTT